MNLTKGEAYAIAGFIDDNIFTAIRNDLDWDSFQNLRNLIHAYEKCCEISGYVGLTDDEPDQEEVVQEPVEDPESEQETEKPKKSNKRIEIDMGKVKALRTAGRSVEWIADDMKVSPAIIYKRLKEEGDM